MWGAFADNLRATLSDLSIARIDTIRDPIKILEPRASNVHLLEYQLNLGVPNKPLDVSVRFGIKVRGATSPLATNTAMDLRFTMSSVEVLTVLFATTQESRFTKFPLKDIFNFSCWLSTIPASSIDVGLAMENLEVILDQDILAYTMCVSCSNAGLRSLNSIVEFIAEHDFVDGLKTRALSIASEVLRGDWVQGMVDGRIDSAARLCPHDVAFGLDPPEDACPAFKATRGVLYATGRLCIKSDEVVISQTFRWCPNALRIICFVSSQMWLLVDEMSIPGSGPRVSRAIGNQLVVAVRHRHPLVPAPLDSSMLATA